jgi:hypothetical protein
MSDVDTGLRGYDKYSHCLTVSLVNVQAQREMLE